MTRSFNLSPYLDIAGLLKQIAADRAEGIVVQNSGYEPGVASVAAPIRDVSGRIVAAINVSAVALLANEAELNGPLKAEVLARQRRYRAISDNKPSQFRRPMYRTCSTADDQPDKSTQNDNESRRAKWMT